MLDKMGVQVIENKGPKSGRRFQRDNSGRTAIYQRHCWNTGMRRIQVEFADGLHSNAEQTESTSPIRLCSGLAAIQWMPGTSPE
jgi:hypothetical protein